MFERVKNNSMIRNGMEIYSIAKEVYNIVNNKESTDMNKSLNSAEEIYVAAVHKVTETSEKKIKSRPDYKIVHYGAQTYRKVKSVARGTKKIMKKRFNKVKTFISARVKEVNTLLKRVYSSCKRRFLDNKLMRSERMKNLKLQLKLYQTKTNDLASEIYKQVDNFVGFEECKNYASKLSNDVITYVNGAKNKVVESKNVIVDVASNNIASATKMANYSYYFMKQMVDADVQALRIALDTNKSLLIAYLKNLELEMYYSPDQSIKIIETLKQYANVILKNNTSDTVSQSSAHVHEDVNHREEQAAS